MTKLIQIYCLHAHLISGVFWSSNTVQDLFAQFILHENLQTVKYCMAGNFGEH